MCGHLPGRFFELTRFSTFESDPSLSRHGDRAPLCCLVATAPPQLPRSTTHNALLLCQEVPERPGGRGRHHWCCPGDRGGRRLVLDYKGDRTKKVSQFDRTKKVRQFTCMNMFLCRGCIQTQLIMDNCIVWLLLNVKCNVSNVSFNVCNVYLGYKCNIFVH